MDRFRGLPTKILLVIGSVGGFLIGGYLGLVSERGAGGLITVVGAVGGAAVGTYIAQLMAAGSPDDEH